MRNFRKRWVHSQFVPSCALLVSFVVAFSFAPRAGSALVAPIEAATDQAPLDLRVVALDSTRMNAGSTFHISVELHNPSTESVIISNALSEFAVDATVRLTFTDESGHTTGISVGMASDQWPTKIGPPNILEVMERWMLLQGGQGLCRNFNLRPQEYPALDRAGKYKVIATYAASGYDYQMSKGDPNGLDKPSQSFGFKSWSGRIESDPIAITIVGHKTSQRKPGPAIN